MRAISGMRQGAYRRQSEEQQQLWTVFHETGAYRIPRAARPPALSI
jgi:hypothetical protein